MMYQFVRVTAKGAEQTFNDVKSAFDGKEPTDTMFVVCNGKRFRVMRAE